MAFTAVSIIIVQSVPFSASRHSSSCLFFHGKNIGLGLNEGKNVYEKDRDIKGIIEEERQIYLCLKYSKTCRKKAYVSKMLESNDT